MSCFMVVSLLSSFFLLSFVYALLSLFCCFLLFLLAKIIVIFFCPSSLGIACTENGMYPILSLWGNTKVFGLSHLLGTANCTLEQLIPTFGCLNLILLQWANCIPCDKFLLGIPFWFSWALFHSVYELRKIHKNHNCEPRIFFWEAKKNTKKRRRKKPLKKKEEKYQKKKERPKKAGLSTKPDKTALFTAANPGFSFEGGWWWLIEIVYI